MHKKKIRKGANTFSHHCVYIYIYIYHYCDGGPAVSHSPGSQCSLNAALLKLQDFVAKGDFTCILPEGGAPGTLLVQSQLSCLKTESRLTLSQSYSERELFLTLKVIVFH